MDAGEQPIFGAWIDGEMHLIEYSQSNNGYYNIGTGLVTDQIIDVKNNAFYSIPVEWKTEHVETFETKEAGDKIDLLYCQPRYFVIGSLQHEIIQGAGTISGKFKPVYKISSEDLGNAQVIIKSRVTPFPDALDSQTENEITFKWKASEVPPAIVDDLPVLPHKPEIKILYEDENIVIKTIDNDVFGQNIHSVVNAKFLYNGRFVTKQFSKLIKLFSVNNCKSLGLELKETKIRIGKTWVKSVIDAVLFVPTNPDAGEVKFVDNPYYLSNPFIDSEYIKCGIKENDIVVSNFITEPVRFKFNRGFIISSSVSAGNIKTFPKIKLDRYSGKEVSFEWAIINSNISGIIESVTV